MKVITVLQEVVIIVVMKVITVVIIVVIQVITVVMVVFQEVVITVVQEVVITLVIIPQPWITAVVTQTCIVCIMERWFIMGLKLHSMSQNVCIRFV